jgi:putative GTP pyrophosphokinase
MLARVPRALCLHHGFPDGLICEIQLRTILQQAWAEVEHELVYKGGLQPFEEHIKRKLAALKANLNLADTLFQEIRESQRVLQQQTRLQREQFFKTAKSRVAGSGSSQVPCRKEGATGGKTEEPVPSGGMSAGMMQRVDELLLKALHAHNNNNYEQAIVIYSSILKQKLPLRVRSFLYNHRGMAYFSDRRYQKALHDFSAAVSLHPENDRAFYCRGLIHQLLGRHDKAIDDFSHCLAVNPYHVNALCSRAKAYATIGDAQRASADCAAALKLNPDSMEAQQLLASLQ